MLIAIVTMTCFVWKFQAGILGSTNNFHQKNVHSFYPFPSFMNEFILPLINSADIDRENKQSTRTWGNSSAK